MKTLAPDNPKSRFDVYRFFNGLSEDAKRGLDLRRSHSPFVKTFLLEHVSKRNNGQPKTPVNIFERLGADVKILDDDFMGLKFVVQDKDSNRPSPATTGFLERYDERFFAYYTCENSNDAKARVEKWVHEQDLDHAWFSGSLLQVLWNKDISQRGDNRIGKLVFKHESIFDMPEDSSSIQESGDNLADEDPIEDDTDFQDSPLEERFDIERPKARFEMKDRIGKMKGALANLQEDYEPLSALHAVRFPSQTGRGSHDLYQDGRITNWTDSFEDHRNMVRYLYRIYKSILDATEESAWAEIQGNQLHLGKGGVPLIIKFDESLSLSETTFQRWVQKAFQKRNAFKLWGDPIFLGPTKVHVYGADRHLWQPINLELTSTGIVAILSPNTCGNTFHRLITNIQQYVCPKIKAWVGSEPFENLVDKWPSQIEKSSEN